MNYNTEKKGTCDHSLLHLFDLENLAVQQQKMLTYVYSILFIYLFCVEVLFSFFFDKLVLFIYLSEKQRDLKSDRNRKRSFTC